MLLSEGTIITFSFGEGYERYLDLNKYKVKKAFDIDLLANIHRSAAPEEPYIPHLFLLELLDNGYLERIDPDFIVIHAGYDENNNPTFRLVDDGDDIL